MGVTGAAARGRPPRDAGTDGRARLLTAARHEFGRRGYGATTIDHLSRTAGVNAPTLYHHFGGKAGLFLAAAQDAYVEVLSEFEHALGRTGPSFGDALDAIFDVAVRLMDGERALAAMFLVIQFELPRQPELAGQLRPVLGRFRRFFDTVAGRAPADLAASAEDRRHLGRALVSIINGLNGEALLLPRPEDFPLLVAKTRALLQQRSAGRSEKGS